MTGQRRRLQDATNPTGRPNLAERISALQRAQLAHKSAGKRPTGGQPVMPSFLRQVGEITDPFKHEKQRVWLVDSDTWEDAMGWPGDVENDGTGTALKENGCSPENFKKARDVVRLDSVKAKSPMRPLQEASFHSGLNGPDSSRLVHQKVDAFLNSVSLLAPPVGASREECEELNHIINMANSTFSKGSAGDEIQQETAVASGTESRRAPIDTFDDFMQTFSSSGSSSDGVTSLLRSMWEEANDCSTNGSNSNRGSDLGLDIESFENSFGSFGLSGEKGVGQAGSDPWQQHFPTTKTRDFSVGGSQDKQHWGVDQLLLDAVISPTNVSTRRRVKSNKSRKSIPASESRRWPAPYEEQHRGVLGIEERVDEFEAASSSPRGLDNALEFAARSMRQELALEEELPVFDPFDMREEHGESTPVHRVASSSRDSKKVGSGRKRSKKKESTPPFSLTSNGNLHDVDQPSQSFNESYEESLALLLRRNLDEEALSSKRKDGGFSNFTKDPPKRLDPPTFDPLAVKVPPPDAPVDTPKAARPDKRESFSVHDEISPSPMHASFDKTPLPVSVDPVDNTGLDEMDMLSIDLESGEESSANETGRLSSEIEAMYPLGLGVPTSLQKPPLPVPDFSALLTRPTIQQGTNGSSFPVTRDVRKSEPWFSSQTPSVLDDETESTIEDSSVESMLAVLQGKTSMEPLRNVHLDSAERMHRHTESASQMSEFSAQSSFLTTTPRSANSQYLANDSHPHGTRNSASDPIRNYWRNFADVKTWGSFDSMSFVNGSTGMPDRSDQVETPFLDTKGPARVEEYDHRQQETYSERLERPYALKTNTRSVGQPRVNEHRSAQGVSYRLDREDPYARRPMAGARMTQEERFEEYALGPEDSHEDEGVETTFSEYEEDLRSSMSTGTDGSAENIQEPQPVQVREPKPAEKRRGARKSSQRQRRTQMTPIKEELPKQVADQLLYVMAPLLSSDTDLETTYTDEETKADNDAEEEAQKGCVFGCGTLEFTIKGLGFPCSS